MEFLAMGAVAGAGALMNNMNENSQFQRNNIITDKVQTHQDATAVNFMNVNNKPLPNWIQNSGQQIYNYPGVTSCPSGADCYGFPEQTEAINKATGWPTDSTIPTQLGCQPSYPNQNVGVTENFEGDFDWQKETNKHIEQNQNPGLLDLEQRPISDFSHNNMVPFFKKATQNMVSTGVPQGNFVDDLGSDVDSGFNGQTPNYQTLALFTGCDDTYLHKRETGPFFSPEEQMTDWVFGMPGFRPDLSRYQDSITIRNNESPTEAIQVGPGINIDASIPAQGGYQQYTRIMPNNVSDYKANQLENRVITQGWQLGGSKPTTTPGIGLVADPNDGSIPEEFKNVKGTIDVPGVAKHRPDTYWSQCRYPTVFNKASFTAEAEYPDYISTMKPKNPTRMSTNYGLGQNPTSADELDCKNEGSAANPATGPIGTKIPVSPIRDKSALNLDNNIKSRSDCNQVPTGNPAIGGVGGPIVTNWYANLTKRGQINPTLVEQTNLRPAMPSMWNNLSFQDNPGPPMETNKEPLKNSGSAQYLAAKPTQAETFPAFPTGNPHKNIIGDPTSWKYEDLPKPTTGETTSRPIIGAPARERDTGVSWKFKDLPKPTTAETTSRAFNGNIAPAGNKAMTNYEAFTGTTTNNVTADGKQAGAGAAFGRNDAGVESFTNGKQFAAVSGADTYTIKGSTLIKNWTPGAERSNILQDPDQALGAIDFGTFGTEDTSGPGTLNQTRPTAIRQENYFIGKQHVSPNKLVGLDDRQLASYQVKALTENPLSIYSLQEDRGQDCASPQFFTDVQPNSFSSVTSTTPKGNVDLNQDYIPPSGEEGPGVPSTGRLKVNPIFPNADGTRSTGMNPNSTFLWNTPNNANPGAMLGLNFDTESRPKPFFLGKGYSGDAQELLSTPGTPNLFSADPLQALGDPGAPGGYTRISGWGGLGDDKVADGPPVYGDPHSAKGYPNNPAFNFSNTLVL